MRRVLPLLMVLAGAATASADEVQLRNGRTIKNCIAKQDGSKVNLEVGVGTMILDASEVESIKEGDCALKQYAGKRASIESSKKASDWYGLATWCKSEGIPKHVTGLMQKVIELDANHAEARKALGHSNVGGKWMTFDEANAARGMVQFEGKWMSPIEMELIRRKRVEAAERKAAEAEAKAKRKRDEAEMRAAAEEYWAAQMEAMRQAQEQARWARRYGGRRYFGPMGGSPYTIDTFDVVGFLQSKGFLPK